MNFSNILNELSNNNSVSSITDKLPGGLAGGAVAGGLVAMLVGNKPTRKTAGKAVKYGGAAVLGGLAYKAYKDWQQNDSRSDTTKITNYQTVGGAPVYIPDHHNSNHHDKFEQEAIDHMKGSDTSKQYQVRLIKAMIASARADGQIDGDEQRRISEAIDKMNLDNQTRSELLNLFLQPIQIEDIVGNLESMEQKSEVYLASCLAINLDHESEYVHLSHLAKALGLPPGLEQKLRAQTTNTLTTTA